MVRSRHSMKLLCAIAICGLAIAFAAQYPSQPAKAAEDPATLKDWEFPDAESHRSGNVKSVFAGHVNKVFAADYATPQPFEKVWAYYAKKIGYEKEYKPNGTYAGGAGEYQILILNSSNDRVAARVRRPSAKSATLIRRSAGGNVTIFISRASDEDKTYFTLIVEGK